MTTRLAAGFRRVPARGLLVAMLAAALVIPAAAASTTRTTTKNPICSRLDKTIGLSAGAHMYCQGAVRSSPRTATNNAPRKPSTPKNVNAANPREDVSAAGARGYGQSEESVAAVGKYVVEAWNDSTGFNIDPSICAAQFKEETTGYGFSSNGGKSFKDLGGLPNNMCAGSWRYSGDPSVEGWKSGGTTYFYIQSLFINQFNGVSDIALDTCTASGATLSCNSKPTIVAAGAISGGFGSQFLDKDYLALDAKRGRLYSTYTRFTSSNNGQAELAVCNISGSLAAHPSCHAGTSTTPYFVYPLTNVNCETEGAYPAVDQNTGEVYVAWEYNWATNFLNPPCTHSSTPTQEKVAALPLSCLTLTAVSPCKTPKALASITIDSMDSAFPPGYNRGAPALNDFPRIAVSDPAGTVSILWNDGRKPTGEILMQSYKLGTLAAVQSHPVRLNNNKGPKWVFFPGVRNADKSGKLDVVWYDRRNSNPSCEACTDLYAAIKVSPTTTKTPKANVRITNVSSNWNAVSSDIFPNFGDYTDDLVVGKVLYIAWADGRLGVPQPFFAKQGG